MTAMSPSTVSMSWTAPSGAHPAVSYDVYRSGTKYASTTDTFYTDSAATNATTPVENWGYVGSFSTGPVTTYRYAVSAVDADGNEGPKQTQMTVWMWHGQSYFLAGDYSNVTPTYDCADAGAAPGPYAIQVTRPQGITTNWFQPFSGTPDSPPQNVPGAADGGAPGWDLEIGAFNYMIVDIKPTLENQVFNVGIVSRGPMGDVFNKVPMSLPCYNTVCFGPNPMVVGQWNHYKIPLNNQTAVPSLDMGVGSFMGSISGTTLTVTSIAAGGSDVQASAWITGPGISPNTFVSAQAVATGPGTFTVQPSQNVGAGTFTVTRTNMYKAAFLDQLTNIPTNVYYVNNWGFTTE
jgi:hypothetical protein